MRALHDYVFETDITSFFDTIDRSILIDKLHKRLRGSSLLEIVEQAVRLEIARTSPLDEKRISQAGIKKGEGLRQGMPLSPVLANFVLSEFDATIENHGYLMVRYADDLVVFADSLNQAKAAQNIIVNELKKINHRIPDISEVGKTRIVGRQQAFDFLGRTIVFSESAGRYVQKISEAKIKAITNRLRANSGLNELIKMQIDFPTFTEKLSRTVASYIRSYSDTYNAEQFENEMRQVYRSILNAILSEIFGDEAVRSAESKHIKFLGLSPRIDEYDDLEIVE